MRISRTRKFFGVFVFLLLMTLFIPVVLIKEMCILYEAICEATIQLIWDKEPWLKTFDEKLHH